MENPKLPKEISNKSKTDIDNSKIITTTNNNINETPKDSKNKNSKKKDKSPPKNEIKQESNKKDEEEPGVPMRSISRCNSIKLYKKHKKEKDRKNKENDKDKDTKDKSGDIFNVSDNTKTKKKKKNSKNKKVKFPPDFVTIIDVESYKKYNEENTCKDPFENMEIVNGRLVNIKNNNEDEPDGKASVLCSCMIF